MKKKQPRYCVTCGALLSKKNKSGYCNHHRDRSGPNNSFYGKTHTVETRNRLKHNCQLASLKMWQDPEYAAKVKTGLKSEANLIAHTSVDFRKKQSENAKKQMKDVAQLKVRSEAMKNTWKLGKIDVCTTHLPNFSKIELKFGKMLEESLGDAKQELTRKFKIERPDYPKHYYCPDFKFRNFVIEIDGDYWHAREKADDEIVHHGLTAKEIRETDAKKDQVYKDNGFTVIRIWATDFKSNQDAVIKTVFEQLNGIQT